MKNISGRHSLPAAFVRSHEKRADWKESGASHDKERLPEIHWALHEEVWKAHNRRVHSLGPFDQVQQVCLL